MFRKKSIISNLAARLCFFFVTANSQVETGKSCIVVSHMAVEEKTTLVVEA